jgi:hypothetical protein
MASIRTLLSLAPSLALVACGGGSDGPIVPEGPHHTFVASQIQVPTGPTQAREFGLDLGGTKTTKPDGMVDNQLGMVLGTLQGQKLDVQGTITKSVDQGGIILLIDFQTKDYTASSAAGLSVKLGDQATAMPKPCSSPTDTVCRHHLDGTGVFTIAQGSPQDALVAGKIVGGTFNGGPGDLALQIAIGGSPITLNLHSARSKASGMSDNGMDTVILAGAVLKTDLDMQVIPNIAAMLGPLITKDCNMPQASDCGCTAGSTGANIITLFDTNPKDCMVTVMELQTNTFIQNLLAPDVCATKDSDCTTGPNALSLGIQVKAVKASFPTPARESDDEIEGGAATTAE